MGPTFAYALRLACGVMNHQPGQMTLGNPCLPLKQVLSFPTSNQRNMKFKLPEWVPLFKFFFPPGSFSSNFFFLNISSFLFWTDRGIVMLFTVYGNINLISEIVIKT